MKVPVRTRAPTSRGHGQGTFPADREWVIRGQTTSFVHLLFKSLSFPARLGMSAGQTRGPRGRLPGGYTGGVTAQAQAGEAEKDLAPVHLPGRGDGRFQRAGK